MDSGERWQDGKMDRWDKMGQDGQDRGDTVEKVLEHSLQIVEMALALLACVLACQKIDQIEKGPIRPST